MGTSTFAQGNSYVNSGGGGTPSGPAGGSLSGTYPNPTIANNVVGNAQLAQMAGNTIKGNASGSTANAADLTPVQAQGVIIPAAAYASLPAASGYTGKLGFATDVGSAGSYVQSDGTRWKPVNGFVSLYQNNSSFVLTGTTIETLIYTINLPAGIMGANDRLEFDYYFTNTGSASNKSLRFRANTTQFTQVTSSTQAFSSGKTLFRNQNSQTSNNTTIGVNPYGSSSSTFGSTTIDTTQALSITINAILVTSSDTLTLTAMGITLVAA